MGRYDGMGNLRAKGERLDSRRQQRRGMIGEKLSDEIGEAHGVYLIELKDEATGKIVERRADNYITPLWANYARYFQMLMPSFRHMLVHNSGVYRNTTSLWVDQVNRTIHPFAQRPFPYNDIILTDSSEAEDVNSSWLKGQVIAWASYWKSAEVAASGARGQINEAECSVSANGQVQKRVWDWSTQQGNGEYQTLGIGVINRRLGFDHPSQIITVGPHTIIGPNQAKIEAALGGDATVVPSQMTEQRNIYLSGGKAILYVTSNTSTYDNRYLMCDIPAGLATTDFDGSGLILDLSQETWIALKPSVAQTYTSFEGMTTASNGNTNHYWRDERGVWVEGTNFYWSEVNPNNTTRNARIGKSSIANPAATTSVWFKDFGTDYGRNNAAGQRLGSSICKIGSYLYVCFPDTSLSGGAGGEGWYQPIYPINESTGALDGLVPLPSGMVITGGLTTDGTDLFVATNKGVVKMTVAGSIVEMYGRPGHWHEGDAEFGLSPWSTGSGSANQFIHPGAAQGAHVATPGGSNIRFMNDTTYSNNADDYHRLGYFTNSAWNDISVEDWNIRKLVFWNGRLWVPGNHFMDHNFVANTRNGLMGLTGANCFSRALLDTPVTKNSSQTMKVSYELTLPDMDQFWHDHETP